MSDSSSVPATVLTGESLRKAIADGMPAADLTRTFGGQTIEGDVDLSGLNYPHRLVMRDCTFRGMFTVEDCHFAKSVDLTGCRFGQGVNLRGAEVGGNFTLDQIRAESVEGERKVIRLRHVRVQRDLSLRQTRAAGVEIADAKITSNAYLNGVRTTGDLNLEGCEIGGNLICRSLRETEPRPEVGGRVSMYGATVGGTASFSGAKIAGDLDLQNCKVGSSLHCRSRRKAEPRPEIGGEVSMNGATVGGYADFSGAKIRGDLSLENCKVGATLFCRRRGTDKDAPRPEVGGKVWMSGATVGGQADFSGVIIAGNLDLQSCEVGGHLLCRSLSKGAPRPEIGGKVSMLGATIGSNADFRGAEIKKDCDILNASVGGNVLADSALPSRPQTTIHGTISLSGTRVEGVASFVGADLRGWFRAVRTEFDDGLYLASGSADVPDEYAGERPTTIGTDQTARFRGIDLSHCRVNAKLSLSGLEVHGPVNLHAVHVQGDIDARSTKVHATRLGRVTADNMQVTGSIDFTGVEIAREENKPCLDLSFADVQGDCRLPGGGIGVAHISLYHAKLGELRFGSDSLPVITADGMAFRRLQFGPDDQDLPPPDGENSYVRFLDHTHPFQKGVYRFVEKHLRDRGQDADADLVFREMLRRDRRDELGPTLLRCDVWLFERNNPRSKRLRKHRPDPAPAAKLARFARVWRAYRATMSSLGWARRVFLDVSTGNGTRSHRISAYLLLVFAFLFWLFANDPQSVKRATTTTSGDGVKALATHTDRKAIVDAVDPKVHPNPDEWQFWEPGFMAFRVTFPMLKIITGKEWEPSDEKVDYWLLPGWKYETFAGVFSTLSYLAVPLFLVSVSGFLKRRGE